MKTKNGKALGLEVDKGGGNDIRGISQVGAACRRFFEKRGMEVGYRRASRFGRSARLSAENSTISQPIH